METLYSVEEIATIFKVHKNSVRRWINENKLQSIKIGGMIRVTETQLKDFISRGEK